MQLQLITDTRHLLAHENEWNRVVGEQLFFRSEWMLTWLDQNVDSVTPSVLVGVDASGQWIGIAPFCVGKKHLLRLLRLLGSGPVCSDYLGLCTLPGFEREFAESVADWMVDNLHPRGPLGAIDAVELEGINPNDANIQYFSELLSDSGFKSHTVELEGCWVVDLPDSWDAIPPKLSKSFRRKIKKVAQRLAEPGTTVLSTDRDDFERLWSIFVDLHQKRRNMLGEAGCFANSIFESFLREATERLIAIDRAELIVLCSNDTPIACSLLINDGVTNSLYQSGMDPENIAIEPGYQLAVLGFQTTIAKGMRRFDFLRGDEPYKSRWRTERVPLVRTRFVPPNLTAQIKHGLWKTGYSVKKWYNTSSSDASGA